MGSGAPRLRLCTHNDMKIVITLVLLGALLAATEGKRRGGKPKKARSGRGGERSWHIASEEGETSCGNSTEIFTTETPSSLCTEAGSNFCICATRGDLEDEEAGEEEDLSGGQGSQEGDEEENEAKTQRPGGQAREDEEEEAEPPRSHGRKPK